MCSFKPSRVLIKNTYKKYYPQITGNKSCDTLEKYARKAYPSKDCIFCGMRRREICSSREMSAKFIVSNELHAKSEG